MKRLHTAGFHLYDILEKRRYKIPAVASWGESRMTRRSTEGFGDSETILCDTVVMDAWHYACVKASRMRSTNGEPQCTVWTRVTMTSECQFLDGNKRTGLEKEVSIMGEAVGRGYVGNRCTSCSVLL